MQINERGEGVSTRLDTDGSLAFFVSEFAIAACPEWAKTQCPEMGILKVRRIGPDAWIVCDWYDHVLSRDVFEWRTAHPSEPLVLPRDNDDGVLVHRKDVARLFDCYPMLYPKDPEYGRRCFTLEEALRVCNVKL